MLDPMDKEELENFLSKKYPLSNLNVHFDPKKRKKKKKRKRKKIIRYSRCKLKKKGEYYLHVAFS